MTHKVAATAMESLEGGIRSLPVLALNCHCGGTMSCGDFARPFRVKSRHVNLLGGSSAERDKTLGQETIFKATVSSD